MTRKLSATKGTPAGESAGVSADEVNRVLRRRPGPKPGTEAARRGGQATAAKHSREFYSHIGKIGGTTTRQSHGPDFYQEIGAKGGSAARSKPGKGTYVRRGRVGGKKMHERESMREESIPTREVISRREQA